MADTYKNTNNQVLDFNLPPKSVDLGFLTMESKLRVYVETLAYTSDLSQPYCTKQNIVFQNGHQIWKSK